MIGFCSRIFRMLGFAFSAEWVGDLIFFWVTSLNFLPFLNWYVVDAFVICHVQLVHGGRVRAERLAKLRF